MAVNQGSQGRIPSCDYREFRPYLNQHPWGTLIADLVDAHWFFCWQALRSLKTGSLCLAQSSGASKCREFVSRKNPVLDQQEFGRVDQGEAAFPLREDKRRRNRLSPAKRRVAGIGAVIPRPEESQPRAPVPAVRLPWAPGRLCPRLNAYVTADSRQNSCEEFDATISHSAR